MSEGSKGSRRKKGTGSITWQEKEHRWRGAIWHNGEYHRVYGPTPEATETRLKHLIADLERARKPKKRGPDTVESYLTAWLRDRVKPHREPKTYRSHSTYVNHYIIPALGKRYLTELSVADVQKFVNDLMVKKGRGGRLLAPRTIVQARAVLRAALNDAMREEKITRNVAELARPPRVRRYRATVLTPDQARKFMQVIQGDQHEGIFTVAIACGLRLGEILALRWFDASTLQGDVDLDRGLLMVNHSLDHVDGVYVLKDPKTDESQRVLVLPDGVTGTLRRHKARQNEERLKAGRAWQDQHDLVFTTSSRYGVGRPLNGPWVTKRFQGILAEHDLPKLRFHDLRHSCASLLIAQGMDLKHIKDLLGHSQLSMTIDTYAHLYEEGRRLLATRMNDTLWEPEAK